MGTVPLASRYIAALTARTPVTLRSGPVLRARVRPGVTRLTAPSEGRRPCPATTTVERARIATAESLSKAVPLASPQPDHVPPNIAPGPTGLWCQRAATMLGSRSCSRPRQQEGRASVLASMRRRREAIQEALVMMSDDLFAA